MKRSCLKTCVGKKIPVLMRERKRKGWSNKQVVAIAFSMCRKNCRSRRRRTV